MSSWLESIRNLLTPAKEQAEEKPPLETPSADLVTLVVPGMY
jgi:hypothetical protein